MEYIDHAIEVFDYRPADQYDRGLREKVLGWRIAFDSSWEGIGNYRDASLQRVSQ